MNDLFSSFMKYDRPVSQCSRYADTFFIYIKIRRRRKTDSKLFRWKRRRSIGLQKADKLHRGEEKDHREHSITSKPSKIKVRNAGSSKIDQ